MTKKAQELATHEKDTGSSEVQIALLTEKIENISKHIKKYKKDKHSSVGLVKAVNRRKKLLNYLKRNKIDSYKNVLTKLKLMLDENRNCVPILAPPSVLSLSWFQLYDEE